MGCLLNLSLLCHNAKNLSRRSRSNVALKSGHVLLPQVTFEVSVVDSTGQLIGEGTHKRVVVKAERFMQKANEKLSA